jgi:hypothetical protein
MSDEKIVKLENVVSELKGQLDKLWRFGLGAAAALGGVAVVFGIQVWNIPSEANKAVARLISGEIEAAALSSIVKKVEETAIPRVEARVLRRYWHSVGSSDEATPFDGAGNTSDLPKELATSKRFTFASKNIPENASEILAMARSGLDRTWGDYLRVYKIWTQHEGKRFTYRFVVKSNSETNNQLNEQYFWLPITDERAVSAEVLSDISPGTPRDNPGAMTIWIAG